MTRSSTTSLLDFLRTSNQVRLVAFNLNSAFPFDLPNREAGCAFVRDMIDLGYRPEVRGDILRLHPRRAN